MAWASYQGLRIMMVIAGRWARLGSFSALDYYRPRQLQTLCSASEEDPEPRPTNPWPFPAISLS
jgi:hypothetical protein